MKILFVISPLYNKLNELTIFVYSYFEKGCRKKCTFYRSQLFAESTKASYKTHRNVYLGFCHYIGYTRPYGKPGQDWTGLVSRVQSSFSIWSATHPCPFTRRTFFNTLHFWLGLLNHHLYVPTSTYFAQGISATSALCSTTGPSNLY